MSVSVPLASVIIPYAPHHAALVERAMRSAQAQTLPVDILTIEDRQMRGAGWARNQGIAAANTPFVVFLDADDELTPTFVERTYAAHLESGRYVYSDWFTDAQHVFQAPDCAWIHEDWHAVTTLLPTEWARLYGFDEALKHGGEDSEFYFHLVTEHYCGVHIAEPLFVYHPDGQRSKAWRGSPDHEDFYRLIQRRYTDKGKIMGCCADPSKTLPDPNQPSNQQMVLVRPRWGGNRRERGIISGTLYPNADNGRVIEIDARDAAVMGHLFEVVARPPAPAPVPAPVPPAVAAPILPPQPVPPLRDLAQHALRVDAPRLDVRREQTTTTLAPDVAKVTRIAQQKAEQVRLGEWRDDAGAQYFVPQFAAPTVPPSTDPVFVFPDTDYPSYTDVRRLVELSGYTIMRQSQAALEAPSSRLIFLTPEQPDHVGDGDRSCIWWSLEYGGEYEPDLSNWRGEVWASDPTWAQAHGAKLVVMGSHEGLAQSHRGFGLLKRYDVTLLGYRTPRRDAIRQQLADLTLPAEDYPGYGLSRDEQLVNSKFMLQVHQREDTQAIAPQRIALCAAYKLPLICERVPDPGDYGHYLPFIAYPYLNAELRAQLAMYEEGMAQARADMLHHWLCRDWTFRKGVEQALKS